ncbi:serine/threonine protein kinase [bacterium]|nr:serine/threonine protein kinase [bacterium]
MEGKQLTTKFPSLFGKYYLLELVNLGGMAEIFKAKMFGVEGFEKIVAIKRILPEVAVDEEFIKMFIDEAKIAVRLQHPNIVQIYELGNINGSYFIAMELVNGKDLKVIRQRLKRVELLMPVEQSAYIISQVCDGLDYAHRKTDEHMNSLNIVHRDVSPQNIIVSYEGNVKLIDFGIAKAQSKSTKTQAGMVKGKFSYMSPEQVNGKVLDRRSDIFSLGVVFFEMLTGKRLFLGKSDVETLEKVRAAEVVPPSMFNSSVPPEIDRIVMKALAREREDRYQWASEFSDDLKKFSYSSDKRFSRQDMMNFMSEFFADELEEETAKLESYKKIPKPPEVKTPAPESAPAESNTSSIYVNRKASDAKKVMAILISALVLIAITITALVLVKNQKDDTAALIINSEPQKTIVVLDKGTMYQKRCETPCVMEGLLPGQREIEFSREGYIPLRETVILGKGDRLEKFVKLYKVGEQKTMITVKSDPDDAVLYVNDKKAASNTPTVVSDIPVGMDVVVRVEKRGYYPYEENIGKVPANSNKELEIVLKPMKNAPAGREKVTKKSSSKSSADKSAANSSETAYITIQSNPWANVYLDGKLIGSTPISKFALPAGSHKIQFKNPKSKIDKTFPVELKPGDHHRMVQNFY